MLSGRDLEKQGRRKGNAGLRNNGVSYFRFRDELLAGRDATDNHLQLYVCDGCPTPSPRAHVRHRPHVSVCISS